MTIYIALLRAVNVGGTGKLPMADFVAICARLGFARAKTYIASGNVVFDAVDDATTVRGKLEGALAAYAGQPVGVAIRDRAELARALAANPFADAPPNRCAIVFLNDAPAPDALSRATGRRSERIALGEREIYIDYPDGMGATKLKLPAAAVGTARNLNTVAKLIAIADAMEI